jgi:hypothetical protein
MKNNKVFILLPDGVGLRNFAYTDFYKKGVDKGLDLVFWNNTTFDLSDMGFKEVRVDNAKMHPATDILKRARVQIDLNLNIKRDNDTVYNSYRFPFSYRNAKAVFKTMATRALASMFSSEKGVEKIRKQVINFERKTSYYKACVETLQKEKPAMVFCTNQRTVLAVAPIVAAQDLGIPTATFIFSWDNLPKATLVLETDFYFVWSDHMKQELMHYYPYINANQIVVTGTPQFETHADRSNIDSRATFFSQYNLDVNRKYICYSGDDITTSPNDPQYLQDTVDAVRKLNADGQQLGIIFRRCPVDFSKRYDQVLQKNADIITPIDPKWKKMGDFWNAILPTIEDMKLQMNTIAHTEMVINLGSSMVFDYISYGKACAYLNYEVENPHPDSVSIRKIYDFVHFRSMPSKDAVLWIDSADSIETVIDKALHENANIIKNAQLWFEKINQHPPKDASVRILDAMEKIVNNSGNTAK